MQDGWIDSPSWTPDTQIAYNQPVEIVRTRAFQKSLKRLGASEADISRLSKKRSPPILKQGT